MDNIEVQAKLKIDTTEAEAQLKALGKSSGKITTEEVLPKTETKQLKKSLSGLFGGKTGLGNLGKIMRGAMGGVEGLGAALGGMAGSLGVVAIVIALIMKLLKGTDTMQALMASFEHLFDVLRDTLAPVLALVGEVLIQLFDIVAGLLPILKPFVQLIADLLLPVVWLLDLLRQGIELLQPFLDFFNQLVGLISRAFREAIGMDKLITTEAKLAGDTKSSLDTWETSSGKNIMEKYAKDAADSAKLTTGEVVGIAVLLGAALINIWNEVKGWFKDIWGGIKGWFKDIWKGIEDWFNDLWKGIGDWFKNTWDNLKTWFNDLWTNIGNWFKDIWDKIKSWFVNLWQGVKDIWEKIGAWFSNLWTGIKEWFVDLWTNIGNWFANLWQGIKDIWDKIGVWFKDIWDKIGTWFTNLWNSIKGWFIGILDSLRNWFNGLWANISGWFSSIWDGIGNWFKGLFGGKKASGGTLGVGAQIWGMSESNNPEFLFNSGGYNSVINADMLEAAMYRANVKASGTAKTQELKVSVKEGVSAGPRELAQWLLPSLKFQLGG